jgi:hypothetical protein
VLLGVGEHEVERRISEIVPGVIAQCRGQLDASRPCRVGRLQIGGFDRDLPGSLWRQDLAP